MTQDYSSLEDVYECEQRSSLLLENARTNEIQAPKIKEGHISVFIFGS